MKFKFLTIATTALMFAACNEPLNEAVGVGIDSNESEKKSTKSHWGNRIENPYTVTNMRLAFKELMKKENNSLSKLGISEQQIKTTHLHLKFIPKTYEELDLLDADTILNAVPVPFDYDLEGFDGVYRDPECPAGQPTYQYAVVRINHKLPNVEYVVLDSLFMPMEEEVISKKAVFRDVWDELENESLKLTGNYDECIAVESKLLSKRYKPSGRVDYYDNSLNKKVGIPNAKVHVNFSTHIYTGFTNSDGDFTINDNFRNKVHYHVYYKNGDFGIYNSDKAYEKYDAGSYGGRSKNPCYDFRINSPLEKTYAITHIAAYKFMHTDNGIKNSIGKKIHICKFYNSERKAEIRFINTGDIFELKNVNTESEISFAAAINGMAGIMLENFDKSSGKDYIDAFDKRLQESWRTAVDFKITKDYYSTYTQPIYGSSAGLMIDLMDNDNSIDDNVSGYTLKELEGYMKSVLSYSSDKQWDKFKELLKERKTASEKNNLDKLFRHWQNY